MNLYYYQLPLSLSPNRSTIFLLIDYFPYYSLSAIIISYKIKRLDFYISYIYINIYIFFLMKGKCKIYKDQINK